MEDDPDASMRDAGIARTHKLADSSTYAIVAFLALKSAKPDKVAEKISKKQDSAIKRWMQAMNKAGWNDALDELEKAARFLRHRDEPNAHGCIAGASKILSLGLQNLRFGDADLNTLILHAWDPNIAADGTQTPLSEEIYSAVRELGELGLIPDNIAIAATTQAEYKETREPLSSSRSM